MLGAQVQAQGVQVPQAQQGKGVQVPQAQQGQGVQQPDVRRQLNMQATGMMALAEPGRSSIAAAVEGKRGNIEVLKEQIDKWRTKW
jgi:hypothetical protein